MNWNEAKILFKYPSRSRPENFFRGLDSIKHNLSQPDKCVIVYSFDTDDAKMNNNEVLSRIGSYGLQSIINFGSSKSKIDAINRDMDNLHGADIIICMSDDMVFKVNGFDDIIRKDFATYFPNGDGFIHYPDQNQGSRCATMNITDVKYYNRFGYIYAPCYESVECDLENQEVAQLLGKYQFVDNRLFDHLHPSFGQAQYDEQYNKTENWDVHGRDKERRKERKRHNYMLIKDENGVWDTPPIVNSPECETKKMLIELREKLNECNSIVNKIESLDK